MVKLKKNQLKKIKSTKLIHGMGYETKLTTYKTNYNKL
jgi:hypothetical protein